MQYVKTAAWWLLIIGGLNWLLVGFLSWDISMLFGGPSAIISRVIFVLVGLSALYMLFAKFMVKGSSSMSSQSM